MGWVSLVLLITAIAAIVLAWRDGTRQTSADERIASAVFVMIAVACFGLALVVWVAWVSFR